MRRTMLASLPAAAVLALALPTTAGAQTTFSISVNTGADHIRNITLRKFIEQLSAATDGELVGELFENGQLYSGRDVPRAVARGDVDMGVPATVYLGSFEPNWAVLDLPIYSALASEDFFGIVDGEIGQTVVEATEERLGVEIPGRWLLLGATHTFGSGEPIDSLAALEGRRIRIPGGAAIIAAYSALGADAVTISFGDLPVALSQGTVDGVGTTHETIRSGQLWEAGLTSVYENNMQTLFYVPMVSESFWNGLSEDQQAIFADTWDSLVDEQRAEAQRRQSEAADINEENGIVRYQPSPEEKQRAGELLAPTVDGLVEELDIDPDLAAAARAAVDGLQ